MTRVASFKIGCMTIRDTLQAVAKAVSVRLDDDALVALRELESRGVSRSQAIRQALIDAAARLDDKAALAAEVQALEADERDRAEMAEVAALMEALRAPG